MAEPTPTSDLSAEIERIFLDHWAPLIGWRNGSLDMDAVKFHLYDAYIRDKEANLDEAVIDELAVVLDEVRVEREATAKIIAGLYRIARCAMTGIKLPDDYYGVMAAAEGWLTVNGGVNPT